MPMLLARPRFPLRSTSLSALAMLSLLAAPLPAQERDCECVDGDGRTIENCVCFELPDVAAEFVRGVPRARIGVSVEEHLDGAEITSILDDAPARAAGLRVGDVIVQVDGQSLLVPLEELDDERRLDEDGDVAVQRLLALSRQWDAGDALELEILRDGELATVEVEPEERIGFGIGVPSDVRWGAVLGDRDSFWPDVFRSHPGNGVGLVHGDPCALESNVWDPLRRDCVDGVRFVDLNPDLGAYFGGSEGVVVVQVAEGSTMGLEPGDVLVSVDGRGVDDVGHAHRILSSYREGEQLSLRVLRHGADVEVTGKRR